MDLAAALTRLGQFVAAMTVCGSPLFFLYGMAGGGPLPWRRSLVAGAAGLGVASTLGWLMVQAASLDEAASAAFDPAAVWEVATGTSFGLAAGLRLLLFVICLPLVALRLPLAWIACAAAGTAAAASFAWTGHGSADEGAAGLVHLGADILHLVAAAAWIGALAPLAVLMVRSGRTAAAADVEAASLGLERFSGIGLAVVAVLVLSGLANSWFLVGPEHVAALAASDYGQLLILKLILFAAMLGLAAANRYGLSPRLARAAGSGGEPAAIAALKASVIAETSLALAVLALVSWLGTLAPPISG